MKIITTFEEIEAMSWSNTEVPGGSSHPDYVDLSRYTCDCSCGGTFSLRPDGSDGCDSCGGPLPC